MNIKIVRWNNRLGNNITQLINVLKYATLMNYNVIIPSHQFFKNNYIVINPLVKRSDGIVEAGVFFKSKDLKLKNFDNRKVDFEKVLHHLRSIFNFSLLKKTPDLDENTVVIHIRSGDIFKNCIHPAYIPPPFSYYENILDNISFSKIILVSENDANPCVKLLIEKYKNKIIYKIFVPLEDTSQYRLQLEIFLGRESECLST